MKTESEIQLAHDILAAVVSREKSHHLQVIHAALDVLCWVLNHDENEAFKNNLHTIQKVLAEEGCVLERRKQPSASADGVPPLHGL